MSDRNIPSNLVVHLRTALEQIAKRANHQPPSGLTTDHLVGYWQGRAEGICLEARAALENLPDETTGRQNAQRINDNGAREIERLDKELEKELENRDRNADYADQLTNMVGVLLGQDMGEHTSENEPWENAIEALRVAIGSKQSSEEPDAVRAGVSVKDPTPPQEIVLCAAMGPSGFICERPKGHPGHHRDGDNQGWSSEKASAPHAPLGTGQTGVCPHGVWLERKCDQCSPLNGPELTK